MGAVVRLSQQTARPFNRESTLLIHSALGRQGRRLLHAYQFLCACGRWRLGELLQVRTHLSETERDRSPDMCVCVGEKQERKGEEREREIMGKES